MEYLDFCSVISVIRRFISDEQTCTDIISKEKFKLDQVGLLCQIFSSFCDDEETFDFVFDNGAVCRWINGQTRITPNIISYYLREENRELLSDDIENNVLPLMFDSSMATQELYTLLLQDTTVSHETKDRLSCGFPCQNERDKSDFIASVLLFGMERPFRKRDIRTKQLLENGAFSALTRDYIYGVKAPLPCRHFCGREREIHQLHELLSSKGKVFLQGIAGIGKSELIKAYAEKFKKEYTNIIYFTYSGNLTKDIASLDFADDINSNESVKNRFSRHNNFLRRLKEDSLIIVDNFNTTAGKDEALDVVMGYSCRIVFTTRCRFDDFFTMTLKEINDTDELISMMGYFYSDADENRQCLEQIILAVHRHTFAVELSARLLEIGLLEPNKLLNKLTEEKAALDSADIIGITKDGRNCRETYYTHIHTLFSLYRLSGAEKDIMRNLTLSPVTGLHAKLFARWLKLGDMNTVNYLIEKGLIQTESGRIIKLHPMIREVALDEMKPDTDTCRTLLDSIQSICLMHGQDYNYHGKLFEVIESIILNIQNSNNAFYLRSLEDAFPFMDKYRYTQGMKLITDEMTSLLRDKTTGSVSDRALLLSFKAICTENISKAIKLQKDAVEMISSITHDNALLVSNLYSNLGAMYKVNGNLDLAVQNTERAISILEQYELLNYHDSIIQFTNYAVLLCDIGKPELGLSALRKLSRTVKDTSSDESTDYAAIQEAMGGIYLVIGNIANATSHFKKALAIYEKIFGAETEFTLDKKQEFLDTYVQAGINIGKQLLSE